MEGLSGAAVDAPLERLKPAHRLPNGRREATTFL
jgi:hypothetical protein